LVKATAPYLAGAAITSAESRKQLGPDRIDGQFAPDPLAACLSIGLFSRATMKTENLSKHSVD
jgi:hypothetical protein